MALYTQHCCQTGGKRLEMYAFSIITLKLVIPNFRYGFETENILSP